MDPNGILEEYKSFTASQRQRQLLVEYRCLEGCLLLHIWQSPDGQKYYRPAARLPRGSGLGWNLRLPAHGGLLTDFDTSGAQSGWVQSPGVLGVEFNGLVVGCKHAYGHFAASNFTADAAAAEPGKPIRRHDIWTKPESGAIPSPRQRRTARRSPPD